MTSIDSSASRERRLTRAHAAILFVVAFAAVQLAVVLTGVSPVRRGELEDPDAYMRAVRVERLLDTGDWFDGTEPRSNAPFGETSHWTRPLDAVVLTLAAPLTPALGSRRAVFAAAVVVPPLLTLLVCLAAAWAAVPLVGRDGVFLVPVAVLAQPVVAEYSLPGRLDHHPLILLLFVLVLGHAVRALGAERRHRAASAAGVLAGLGLWVSTEFLAPLAWVFAGLAVSWILRNGHRARTGWRFSLGLVVAVSGAVVLEHGTGILSVEYDRISLPHVAVALLALGYWGAVLRSGGRMSSSASRLLVAALGATVASVAMLSAFPAFFRGPWAQVDPIMMELWLRHVTELHPLLPGRGGSLGSILLYLGPATVALPWLVVRAHRSRGTAELPVWLLLVLGLTAFTVLALLQRRWATYAAVLAAVGLVGALVPAVRHLEVVRPPIPRVLARAMLVALAFVGFPILGGVVMAAESSGAPREVRPSPTCAVRSVEPVLDSLEAPRTILGMMDFGPELLYRTPHRVVATPYHRNPGIVDSYRILATMPPADARLELERRGVDLILLCPPRDRDFFDFDPAGRWETSLYRQLTGGEPPPWIRSSPAPANSGFRIFELGEEP